MISAGPANRQRQRALPFLAGLVVACAAFAAHAQENAAEQEPDKSGTNPTVFTRSINLQNEYQRLDARQWVNTSTLRFTQPFAGGRMNIRLSLPFTAVNSVLGNQQGFGDISAKLTWLAYLDGRQGLVVSGEVFAPVAHHPLLGTGKWVVAPGITYAYFLTREIIIAPAVVHNVSFAGDPIRPEVKRTAFDLYTVYKPHGAKWWLTSDLAIAYDYLSHKKPASWKLALGINLGKIGDANVNLSLRPGIGLGRDRAAKWSFELGLAVVGF